MVVEVCITLDHTCWGAAWGLVDCWYHLDETPTVLLYNGQQKRPWVDYM